MPAYASRGRVSTRRVVTPASVVGVGQVPADTSSYAAERPSPEQRGGLAGREGQRVGGAVGRADQGGGWGFAGLWIRRTRWTAWTQEYRKRSENTSEHY